MMKNVMCTSWCICGCVTEQGVTEQNFCGCAFGVNTRIADQNFKVSSAASFIDESGEFYPFWEKSDAGFAWDAWG